MSLVMNKTSAVGSVAEQNVDALCLSLWIESHKINLFYSYIDIYWNVDILHNVDINCEMLAFWIFDSANCSIE